MRRHFAMAGEARSGERPVRSIACLAFVAVLGSAFWAGAAYIVHTVVQLAGQG